MFLLSTCSGTLTGSVLSVCWRLSLSAFSGGSASDSRAAVGASQPADRPGGTHRSRNVTGQGRKSPRKVPRRTHRQAGDREGFSIQDIGRSLERRRAELGGMEEVGIAAGMGDTGLTCTHQALGLTEASCA